MSGGVDSVVLLHMLVQQGRDAIVAHVDHGIRSESDADARFVEGVAKMYGCKFITKRFELGAKASEETARTVRYEFLLAEAKKHNARLVTAHHKDDLVETIAINLRRGTGWRGLAVLGRDDIERPLLNMTKREVYEYALAHHLEWVEDETNRTDVYLRNCMRRKIFSTINKTTKEKLFVLRNRQLMVRDECDEEIHSLLSQQCMNRYFLTHIDSSVATELLRGVVQRVAGIGLTRPMLERALTAIKTAKNGSTHHIGNKVTLVMSLRDFIVKTPYD